MSIAYCHDHDEHVDLDWDTETHRYCDMGDGIRKPMPADEREEERRNAEWIKAGRPPVKTLR